MLVLFITCALICLFIISYIVYAIFEEYRSDRVPVLLYHRIVPIERVISGELIDSEKVYAIYDRTFEEQMDYLHAEGYITISVDDFLAFHDGKKNLPDKRIIITFDDGFMSNYLYAFPVLKKYNMTATIFVTPDPESENFKKYAALDSPLTHEQIREMNNYGISIESHGMTHRYLTELEPDVICWELTESKKVLENITGRSIRFLAIPGGPYNRTVKKQAREAGYEAVFCMLKGTNNTRTDLYSLRRLVVSRDFTIEHFKSMLKPSTASQLRIISFFHNLLFNILAPKSVLSFRNFIYRTKLSSLVIFGQLELRYISAAFAGLILILIILGILIK